MRTINTAPRGRTIIRPQIEVVKYEGSDDYTFQVVFDQSVKTRKGAYTKKEAEERAKAFKDFFEQSATAIEMGQERPYQIMAGVRELFDSEFTPKPKVDASNI